MDHPAHHAMTTSDFDKALFAARLRDAGLGPASVEFLLSRAPKPRGGTKATFHRRGFVSQGSTGHTRAADALTHPRRATVHGLADLWELSPHSLGTADPCTEVIIDALLGRDGAITVALTNPDDPVTMAREALQGMLSDHAWIWTNYIVVEFATGDIDAQAQALGELGEILPLALVYRTCASTLCGWFAPTTTSPELLDHWVGLATCRGATCHRLHGAPVPVQMPDGIVIGSTQRARVFFFAPTPTTPLKRTL